MMMGTMGMGMGMGMGFWVEVVGRREGVRESGREGVTEWYSSLLVSE